MTIPLPGQLDAGLLEVRPDLLTIPEAGHRLGLSRPTVYRLVSRGDLELVHPVPGASRITVRSVERYLRSIGVD